MFDKMSKDYLVSPNLIYILVEKKIHWKVVTSYIVIDRFNLNHTAWKKKYVIISSEGLQNLGLGLRPVILKQGRIFIVPHPVWHGTSVFKVSIGVPPHWFAFNDMQGYSNSDLLVTKRDLKQPKASFCLFMCIY